MLYEVITPDTPVTLNAPFEYPAHVWVMFIVAESAVIENGKVEVELLGIPLPQTSVAQPFVNETV